MKAKITFSEQSKCVVSDVVIEQDVTTKEELEKLVDLTNEIFIKSQRLSEAHSMRKLRG